MDFKLVGSILLIIGTSIGAGMLALPIATAQLGFVGSVALLIGCWVIMTISAFLLLEVTLWLPLNSNLISMAKATVGPLGQLVAWITYLLLLYSLLCAYIAGGSDLFHHLLLARHIDIPQWLSSTVFTAIFGGIVYLGIRSVDYTNRVLMLIKFTAYFLLVAFLTPYVSGTYLKAGNWQTITSMTAITVTITSFGYATIVPSLRIYFGGNVNKVKLAIVIGSVVPLLCYIIWDAIIMGVIPLDGVHGLGAILKSQNSTSDLVTTLSTTVSHNSVTFFTKLFTSICVLTSFLGVGLCLTDFLADGLHLEKKGPGNVLIHAATFLPPLIIVLFFPNVFIKALAYAGTICVILLILLPALMVWRGRYVRHFSSQGMRVFGGKLLLIMLILFSIMMIIRSIVGW